MDSRFVGTWRLNRFEFRISNGEWIYPAGNDAVGMLSYDDDGRMAAQIMRPDRPEIASGDQKRGTDLEVRAGYEGYLAYYGTYEVDEPGQRIIHRVEGSLFSNWVGTDQIRLFEFEGGQLHLHTEPLCFDDTVIQAFMSWSPTSVAIPVENDHSASGKAPDHAQWAVRGQI